MTDKTQKRAYSLMTLKAVNEELREITGIASTPTPDRYGDVMEPTGAKFRESTPFLWQHDRSQPIGNPSDATIALVEKAALKGAQMGYDQGAQDLATGRGKMGKAMGNWATGRKVG